MNNKRHKRILVAVLIVEVIVVGLIFARVAALFCCMPSFTLPTLIARNTELISSTIELKTVPSQTPSPVATQTRIIPTKAAINPTNTLILYTPSMSPTITPSKTPTQTYTPTPTSSPTKLSPTITPTPILLPTSQPITGVLPAAPLPIVILPTVAIPTALLVIVPIPTAIPTVIPLPTKVPTQVLATATSEPSLTPVPPTPTLSNECNWGWATQPLPEVTDAAQAAITNAGLNTSTVRAIAFGENCYQLYTSKVLFFGTMYTDFYLNTPATDLNDLDALAAIVKTAYQTLSTLNFTLPARPGELDITFTSGSESKHFRAMFDDIRPLIEAGKSSAELLAKGWLY